MNDNDKTVFVNYEKLAGDSTLDLDMLYMELGKAYYEGGFEDPLPQLLPLFDKITRVRGGQGEKAKEPEEPVCPNCGMKLEDDAIFCGNCGTKVRG